MSTGRSHPDASDAESAYDLGQRLLYLAVETTRQEGIHALSLRDLQRRAGVSPAAAYRHYRDREALLRAVGHYSSAQLADHVAAALDQATIDTVDLRGDQLAVARLRAGCEAYLLFAEENPGLYRAMFRTREGPEQLSDPAPPARGTSAGAAGRGPFQLLQECLADLHPVTDRAGSAPDVVSWNAVTAWATCHGYASLLLDSALKSLGPVERAEGRNHILGILLIGLGCEIDSPN